ncbi:hypothetical protein [Methanomethylovorans sp.]|uniref:hypothetical protein n=1 Tax=Methanomethylovorans sp. TaxID=2758717 RepID=UPI00351C63E9
MNDNKFHAKILQVKSYIDEFGHTYEQMILVESTRGEIFWIFDPKIICDKQMEGQMAILEFNVWQNADQINIFKLETKQKKIVPPKCLYDRNYPNYSTVFYGEIVGKEHEKNSNRQFTVDVGSGIIRILAREAEYNSFLIGDYIMIEGDIVHLSEVDGRRI